MGTPTGEEYGNDKGHPQILCLQNPVVYNAIPKFDSQCLFMIVIEL